MIRNTVDANSINAYIAVTPGNGVTFQRRTTTGGSSVSTKIAGITAPYWVKLVRSGNTFTAFCSSDGVTWTQVDTASITMNSTVYVDWL